MVVGKAVGHISIGSANFITTINMQEHDAGDEGANEHEDHYVEMAMGVKGGEEVDGVRIVFQIKFFASCR